MTVFLDITTLPIDVPETIIFSFFYTIVSQSSLLGSAAAFLAQVKRLETFSFGAFAIRKVHADVVRGGQKLAMAQTADYFGHASHKLYMH